MLILFRPWQFMNIFTSFKHYPTLVVIFKKMTPAHALSIHVFLAKTGNFSKSHKLDAYGKRIYNISIVLFAAPAGLITSNVVKLARYIH
jgi:hypothetical protein